MIDYQKEHGEQFKYNRESLTEDDILELLQELDAWHALACGGDTSAHFEAVENHRGKLLKLGFYE